MKVSVAVTTFNGRPYLESQLNSILRQNHQPFEVVVCDDGSVDGTQKILQDYEKDYPDLFEVIYNEETLGVTKNFEQAIRKCKGEAIALADQDDIWAVDKLDHQVKALSNQDGGLVFHDCEIVSESPTPNANLWSCMSFDSRVTRDTPAALMKLISTNFVKGSTIVMDTCLRNYVIPIPEIWDYDWYTAIVALLVGRLIAIDKTLEQWRIHPQQKTDNPPNSLYERLTRGLTSDITADYYWRRASKWSIMRDRLEEFPKEALKVDRTFASELIEDRYQYEKKRAIAYDKKRSISEKFSAIYDNTNQGRYGRYGKLPKEFFVLKDSYKAVETSSRCSQTSPQ